MNETNDPSVPAKIAKLNRPIPGLERRVNRINPETRRKAGRVLTGGAVAAIGVASLVLGGMDARDEQRQSTKAVSLTETEAPRQATPDQITDEAPSTTMVAVESGEGPYQVTERLVEDGVVAPEHAAATQAHIANQYPEMPVDGRADPGDKVSVQVGGNR